MVDLALTTTKLASLFVGSIVFFAAMLWVGNRTQDWIESASDFLVSGREINAVIIAFGLAAIGLAGSIVSAVPEFVVTLGFFPSLMYMFSWVVVVILFGLLVSPIIRRSGVYTTCEWMEQRFDRKTRIVTAIGSVLAGIAVTAAQFVGIGAILAVVTDVPFWQTTLFITAVTLAYMYLGGLWAVTVTDFIQVTLGLFGLLLAVAWFGVSFGGPGWLLSNTPEATFALWGTGVTSAVSLQFNSPLTWTLGWMALIVGNQYYWIRIVSARSERDATRGPMLGAVIALGIVTLLALPGAYALAAWGAPEAAGYDIRGIVGVVILQLPIGVDALLLVALLAAVMSTASTTIIGTTTILIRDAWEPLRGEVASSEELVGPSRVFTVVLGLLAWLLAATWSSSAALLLGIGWAFVGPLAAVIILGLVWPRTTGTAAFLGVIAGIVSVLIWEPSGLAAFVHITYPSIFVPAIVAVIVSLVTAPPYYGEGDWEPTRAADTPGSAAPTTAGPDPRTRALFRNLSKPWTPSARWNRLVERRGIRRGGLAAILVGREDEDR